MRRALSGNAVESDATATAAARALGRAEPGRGHPGRQPQQPANSILHDLAGVRHRTGTAVVAREPGIPAAAASAAPRRSAGILRVGPRQQRRNLLVLGETQPDARRDVLPPRSVCQQPGAADAARRTRVVDRGPGRGGTRSGLAARRAAATAGRPARDPHDPRHGARANDQSDDRSRIAGLGVGATLARRARPRCGQRRGQRSSGRSADGRGRAAHGQHQMPDRAVRRAHRSGRRADQSFGGRSRIVDHADVPRIATGEYLREAANAAGKQYHVASRLRNDWAASATAAARCGPAAVLVMYSSRSA